MSSFNYIILKIIGPEQYAKSEKGLLHVSV